MARRVPALLRRLRASLRAVADPARAPAMQAYMKSEMPFWGVPAPKLRVVCREVFADYPFDDAERWRADVLALWRTAKYREERYGALALSGHRKARAFQTLEALPMYEELIVSGAWWDFVDDIASHRIGKLLQLYPREMGRLLRAWSQADDLWKRRTAIIAQLGFGAETDLALLYDSIQPSLSSKEFFLRKAIGWALRQLAWHDPAEVLRYVEQHAHELSPLSRREALKNIARAPAGPARARAGKVVKARRR